MISRTYDRFVVVFLFVTICSLTFFVNFTPFGGFNNSVNYSFTENPYFDLTAFDYSNLSNEQITDFSSNYSKIKIQAGNTTHLQLRDQLQISLLVQDHSELCINISETNPAGSLPAEAHQFRNFYQFELNSSTNLQASLQMSFSENDLPLGVKPQILSWAYYNNYSNKWEYVNSWLNENENMIITETNHFSIWTVLIINDDNKPINPKNEGMNEIIANGSAWKLENGNIYRFRTQFGFELNVSLGETAELRLNESLINENQYMNANQQNIGKMIQFELNKSGVTIQATIGYKLSLVNIPNNTDPMHLKFAYLNEENNQWILQNSIIQEIDSDTVMIYVNTSHFSIWTIIGSETDLSTSNIPGFEFILFIPMTIALFFKKRN